MSQSWSLLLHIYQPPNQRSDILNLVSQEGYKGLLDLLLSISHPVTLNVSGVLLEQLANSQPEILAKIRQLALKKNITFTNTAYSHALLPLWPNSEVEYQFQQQRRVVKEQLGNGVRLRGLYLPECAYSPSLDAVIKRDSSYCLIDEISLRAKEYYPVVRSRSQAPTCIVRHRAASIALATSIDQFADVLKKCPTPLVVALDGEVFGHFDPNALERLRVVFTKFGRQLISTTTLSKQRARHIALRAASWETEPHDILLHNPFPLWDSRHNVIHQSMWHFMHRVMKALHRTSSLLNNDWERKHFSNAMASCWWWWANPKRTAGPFKMRVWNPDITVEGMTEAIKAIRTDAKIPLKTKWRLETEYADLLKRIWQTHWKIHP